MSPRHQSLKRIDPSRQGFTLIEMVLVMAVFSLVVGFAVPLTDKYIRQEMTHQTRDEMVAIRDAVLLYYEDTGELPSELIDLEYAPEGVVNYHGPYMTTVFVDDTATQDDYRHDAWHRPYDFASLSSTQLTLRSLGENGQGGYDYEGGESEADSDDLQLIIDLAPAFWKRTQRELEVINTAIQAYNREHLPDSPLSTDYPTLIQTLQSTGFLPNQASLADEMAFDAWGHPYQTSESPVVEVTSLGPNGGS